jgi:hypothetical protein
LGKGAGGVSKGKTCALYLGKATDRENIESQIKLGRK